MEKIKQALTALGDTPQEVYENLKAQGIKGVPRSPCQCPVANYLSKLVGEKCSTGVTSAGKFGEWETEVSVPLPVQQFICQFDDGLFEDLLEGSP